MATEQPTREVIEIFYDRDCPLCSKEVSWLKRRDGSGAVRFTDIASQAFIAPRADKPREVLMSRIHGRLPDGTFVEGMEVFRRVYSALGLGWVTKPTTWPGLSGLSDAAYRFFARNRLRWTGRCRTGTCRVERKEVT